MVGKTKGKLGIGIIGCGNISMTYLRNAALFTGIELRACADISADIAALRPRNMVSALRVSTSFARRSEVDLVVNLTVPAVHFDVTMSALVAGKRVFTEKPLATSAAEVGRWWRRAKGRGLLLGSSARHLPWRRRPARSPSDGGRRNRPPGERDGLHDGARHGALASQSAILLSARRRSGFRYGTLLPDDVGQSARSGGARHGDGDERPG